MGWRVSWYKADKNEPLKLITEDYGDGKTFTYIDINGECVANNQGTEFWLELKHDEEFKKEIKCLIEDDDCDYYSITKEGFKRIILAYRERIIEYHKQALENEENPTLIGKYWSRCNETPKSLIENELREWEASYKGDNDEICFFNIDLSDKKRVSGSWKYKYGIFDMIYVYKNFDWDNYTMVVFGG